MPWRSRLIASTRSSRSVTSEVCWVSTSRNSSSARRLTAPSRSRSRRSFSSSASTSATSGSRPRLLDARPEPRRPPARLPACRGFRARCRTAGAWRLRCAPRSGRVVRAPRSRHRAPRAPRGRPRRARSRLPPAGRLPARCAASAVCTSPISATRLFLEQPRRVDQALALGARLRAAASRARRSASTVRSLVSIQDLLLAGNRLQPLLRDLGLARQRLRFRAHLGEPARDASLISPRTILSLLFELGRRRQARDSARCASFARRRASARLA